MHNEDRIVIDFAEQRIELPWTDPRCPELVRYDGEPVIVGIRPEALTPEPAGDAAPAENGRLPAARGHKARGRAGRSPEPPGYASSLRGRVSALEYYGHEWLARLDVGLRPVDLAALQARPGPPEPESGGKRGGGHRGASLLIRFDAPRGWAAGQDVSVVVDMPRVLLFDAAGRRIGLSAPSDPPGPVPSADQPATAATGPAGGSAASPAGGSAGSAVADPGPPGRRPGRAAARSPISKSAT